ncbi:MAG: cyclic nucleotide-binding/CBS domain-containing protein [Xanthomonadales bacterium]|nr:CBS domain-containing protein [Gammaproteobacteria bacterium]MBT8051982.1 CBS domain-containing protein [Gammaproteobacteria bacterium]NNJ78340.1 cyclic nucleotide-binding/CBS domain-containing protein [Xanthomonadales bacterium]NNL03966.1 cyclic nucleotide-binding/CBS domain-containing protein [Xanthomonadales bacterium]
MHDVTLATEFLHTVPPFNSLATNDLEKLSRRLEAAYYPQDQEIFRSGSSPGLAVIRKGAVRLVDPDHKFLDKRSEGELFGHGIYFHGELKEYIAEAEEDCLLWHLKPDDFTELREQHPLLEEYFSSHLATRLRAAAHVRDSVTQVRDLLKREPVRTDGNTSIVDAARLMSEHNVSSVLVMRDGVLGGIVTDKDLRQRVIAAGVDPLQPICEVMTGSPMTLEADSDIDAALLLMMRENYHHLPVIEDGRPVGLVTAGDILRAQSEHPLRLVRDIHKRQSVDELVRLSRRLPSLFERMVTLGRDVQQIGRMVTHITDAFTIRLIQLAEARLGTPPMHYAWVVFGSQAREEQTARTDQDNGLVLERKADEDEVEYFSHLSEFVCDGLDKLGYVYCPGNIMAMNPKWRVSLPKWKRHFDGWIDEPEPKSVMHSSIFFDMRCVHGRRGLVEELLKHATKRAKTNRIFRRFMAANVLAHRPPIGFFRRFVQEDDGSQSEGLNLKHRGIVPIIDLVRIRALEAGVSHPNTFRRLEEVTARGIVNKGDARSLRDALVLISRIRLAHQAEQMSMGQDPTNFVPPDELSPLMRRNLKAAFMLVVEAQNALAHRYQVH